MEEGLGSPIDAKFIKAPFLFTGTVEAMKNLLENFLRNVVTVITLAALIPLVSSPANAVVVLSDGFGDADLNNDGTLDGNVQGSVEDETWVPARVFIDGMSDEPENTEVTAALNAGDTGIRWIQMRGWTSAQGNFPGVGNPKPRLSVVDDGAQLETQAGTGGLNRPSLDGYAMSWESSGGGSSAAGFFDQQIELGPEDGDEVKVSFDFRLWGDVPNAEELMPGASELRFGLYQDTDNQLGMTNPFAGRQVDESGEPLADVTNLLTPTDFSDSFRPAVWGQEEGLFEGRLSDAGIDDSANGDRDDIGAIGDNGYSVAAFIGNDFTNPLEADGGGARVREEVNTGRILQGGDVETIAQPENLNSDPFGTPMFDYFNMETEKAYNLSLSLVRTTTTEQGDSIQATLVITDLETMQEYPLTGIDEQPESESWDYFALRNASSGSDEMDFIIDNFLLEQFGSNAMQQVLFGDADNDLAVSGSDLLAVTNNFGNTGPADGLLLGDADDDGAVSGSDLLAVTNNFGSTLVGGSLDSGANVPEPSTILLVCLGGASLFVVRRLG